MLYAFLQVAVRGRQYPHINRNRVLRHGRFGPSPRTLRSFTPSCFGKGLRLLELVLLPLVVLESHRLLVALFILLAEDRSGLRSSFPARPIGFSAFRLGECLRSLADCLTYFALG